MKTIRYAIEACFLYTLFFFFKCLSPSKASDIGGAIGKFIGSKLAVNRKASKNLSLALPHLNDQEKAEILLGMWEHLGRVIAEYPHLEKISRDHTRIIYKQNSEQLFQKDGAKVFFGGHIGNWEVNCAAVLSQLHKPITLTYRKPNNPWTANLLQKSRTLGGRLKGYPKSRESARYLLKILNESGTIGILIDQKYNEGLETLFFNKPAMTNPAFVQLCQRYKCPLFPTRNERVGGCKFTLTLYPPLPLFHDDGSKRPVEDVISDAHKLLEEWITETPEQWIWMHRRWKENNPHI